VGGIAGHELCNHGGGKHVPCGEEDWVLEVGIVEDPFVEEDD
jgi:hypothetical protein